MIISDKVHNPTRRETRCSLRIQFRESSQVFPVVQGFPETLNNS